MATNHKEVILEDINALLELFTDKISELHNVKGSQTERHSFILYRNMLREIGYKVRDRR